MNYSIESIIEQAEQRDHNFAEICRALDELDMPTLERVLVYTVQRREAFNHGNPRIKLVVDEPLPDLEKAKNIVRPVLKREAKEAASADKAVKRNAETRKANTKTSRRREALSHQIADALQSDPKVGVTAKNIAFHTNLRLGTIYAHLKALGAYSNGKGRWWVDKKTYLANFPIAGKKKKKSP